MAPSCAFREAPCHGSVETETESLRSVQSPQRFINPVPTRESLARLPRSRSVVYPGGVQARTQSSSGHSLPGASDDDALSRELKFLTGDVI